MKLRCSCCGTEAACDCGANYIPLEQYALKCAKENPKLNSYQLAEKFDFSQSTATRAMSQLSQTELVDRKIGKDDKSRPTKNKRKDEIPAAVKEAAAKAMLDEGKSRAQAAAEFGIAASSVSAARQAELARREAAQIDPATLPKSAQEKLQRAIKQAIHKLEVEHERRVQEGIKQAIDETVLPHYNKKMEEYDEVIRSRKGVLTTDEFRLILSCLHPDQSASPERLREAFNVFKSHELALRGEKEMPTSSFVMPRNYQDLMKMREEVRAKRKAQRNTAKNLPGIH